MPEAVQWDTHEVFNQPAPLCGHDVFATDLALQEGLARHGAAWARPRLAALAHELSQPDWAEAARLANRHGPELRQYDAQGRRVDELEFHPAWHALMDLLVRHRAHALPWAEPGPGVHVARAAMYLMFGQVENGVQCPVTMSFAAVPALRHAPELSAQWLPVLLSDQYDPRPLPLAAKRGALIGMGMTEKQGGSDVRANTTWAVPAGDGSWRITGHKWFFSVPQADAHLVLAQARADGAGDALSCFLVPRMLPDGSRNAIRIQRLKDKVGNHSNASSEVEFAGAVGHPVGPIGRGIPTILDMASHTRLDCVLGTAGMLRAGLVHALAHARQRHAFGRALSAQPLMQAVLADLALESEAATALALRLAAAFDARWAGANPGASLSAERVAHESTLARLLTPAGKYWVCKRGPMFAAEAMEVVGGNGYVEEGPLARLYRDIPVNSIWEGAGNIMCLDLLRALEKEGDALDVLAAELDPAGAAEPAWQRYCSALLDDLRRPQPAQARQLAERLVLAVQAGLLLRHAPGPVASAFVASRIAAPRGAFGALPDGCDLPAIMERAWPGGLA
jgi:putative acyl-CoA dehydrogenase